MWLQHQTKTFPSLVGVWIGDNLDKDYLNADSSYDLALSCHTTILAAQAFFQTIRAHALSMHARKLVAPLG
ncbi:Uncharacterised protein [Vibrio cholerae]|uniref:Uncharacterized protein n=1 Tax=Vibrio cholerae TaxID=666 RepID=A0A655YW78_VIBCL|nr:Uncharacterised protein [Vibrio cholerae]